MRTVNGHLGRALGALLAAVGLLAYLTLPVDLVTRAAACAFLVAAGTVVGGWVSVKPRR